MVAGLLGSAVGTVLFVWLAATGREVRFFPLDVYVHGESVYFIALLSFGIVVASASPLVAARPHGPRALVISDDWIEAPRVPLRREVERIHRHEIRMVDRYEVSGTRGGRIMTANGKLALANRLVGDDGLAAVEAWLARRSASDAKERG